METPGSAPVVRRAVALSRIGCLPADTIAGLLRGATRATVPAGSTIRPAGERGPHLELVVSGLVRLYMTAPDGRTLTVRYCRPGSLIGLASLFRPGFARPVSSQALVDSNVLHLRPGVVQAAGGRDVRIAAAMIDELSDRIVDWLSEIPGSAFASVRQRVARHLLDLAADQQHGSVLVARISQQQLAEATGSVREVVVRTLRDLRSEGIVETARDRITILRPDRLVGELAELGDPSATHAEGDDWNPGH
jgi:CRP/FNR family transcriptional regulator, cyclic AMP receptor protein